MTEEQVDALFKKHKKEYLKTDRLAPGVEPADARAIVILSKYCIGPVIAGAEHDEVFLAVDGNKFCQNTSEEEIVELIRCGVMNSEEGFKMFV